MKSGNKEPNRLINERSPYLLQHAHNPVNWYPWGKEAFQKAREEDKPVFLSIGYSTCHWCHVMERECFDHPEVAELMNDVCVCIKVDREERPDLDGNFMAVSQVMNNSGGWPLNVFLTPDGSPFFAGTYMPRESKGKIPGMMDIFPRVKWLWSTQREQILQSAESLVESLEKGSSLEPGDMPDRGVIDNCFKELEKNFDEEWGGFFSAPKFPMPGILLFLLQYWQNYGDVRSLEMVEKTLTRMSLGGIYDHLGGGFHRYSTDEKWLVPHFEKMLYDQALLMMIYTRAFAVTGDPLFKRTLEDIASYVISDMTSPEGPFYSAEDADSEGVEGKFYTWEQGEVIRALGEEGDYFLEIYNIERGGNFDEERSGKKTGSNILFMEKRFTEIARQKNILEEDLCHLIDRNRADLLKVRNERVRPFKDDKILTDWNGLMIAAFAYAGRVLGNIDYINRAEKALDFFLKKMKTPEGKLFHRYRDGDAAVEAFLDDYVFMVWGINEIFKATRKEELLLESLKFMDTMTVLFWDNEKGGFYATSEGSEDLFFRRKEAYDGAILSANSVAIDNFIEMAKLTGKNEFTEMAKVIARAFGQQVRLLPSSHSYLLASVMKMEHI